MSTGENAYFLEQNCDNSLKTCNWLASVEGQNCAQEFCYGYPATTGTCPEMGLDPKNCCGSSDPATCLYNWVHGGSGSTSGSNSESGSDNPCASVVEVIYTCSTASPSLFPSGSIYTTGPIATELASCLCYDSSGNDDASAFDAYASKCVSSGSAAHPTYYPYASRLNGFCSNIAGPASTTAALTSTNADTVVTGVATATSGATKTSATGTSPLSTTTDQSTNSACSSVRWKSTQLALFAVSIMMAIIRP
ncbi:hypothetical protein N7494_005513 [Penicillium frequentans]|uniref:Uncharacterized protein n=1 Tax=Penicillium frequentans TaxID=3151616 RepID=A0AAD6GDN2_9EURO|nr:hypothetical protein N7494_005513 [Penicillium glabrum]